MLNKLKIALGLITLSFIFFSCAPQAKPETVVKPITVAQKQQKPPIATEEVNSPEEQAANISEAPPPLPSPPAEPEKELPATKKVAQEKAPATEIPAVVPTPDEVEEQVEEVEETPPVLEEIEEVIPPPTPVKEAIKPAKPNHDVWEELLNKYVSSSGKVNYKGFKSDNTALKVYLYELMKNPVQEEWSRLEKMAYWINAYNAFTIKMIIDHYPVSSIMDIHSGKPWDKKWIELGDKTYTLNNIENDILRPKYKDARIHFAVNCAAKSCPPLLNRAWTPENLNRFFEQQAKAFINNDQYNKITPKKVQISKIFEWYAGDFGNIIDYLNKYSNVKINSNAKLEYLEYDWGLNE